MKKRNKIMAVLPMVALMALMMALIGQKTVYAGEKLSYGCFGDVHIVPILKDEFRAYTSVSCNGSSNGTANPEFETAVNTCYVDTYVEVYGAMGGYDSGSFSASGLLAFDPGLNSWATASVRGANKAQSDHSGGNCYASGLTGNTIWTK